MTLRLDPRHFSRLAAVAGAENRTPANYVKNLLLRSLEDRGGSNDLLDLMAGLDLPPLNRDKLDRADGESEEQYSERKAAFEELLAILDGIDGTSR